jgi:hypothetical protein
MGQVEVVVDNVFKDCPSFETITLPESLVTLRDSAFINCTGLINITFPTMLKIIGDQTFKGYTSLQTIMFPENIITIGNATFLGCTALRNITMSHTLEILGKETFSGCTSLVTIVFPDTTTSVGDSTFTGCTALENITFSQLLESLGKETFRGCTSLVTVVFPETTTILGVDTFHETTQVLTLRMHRDIWSTAVPLSSDRQLVTFYQEPDAVYTRDLVLQRDHWAYDQVNGVTVGRPDDGNMVLLLGHGKLMQTEVDDAFEEHAYQYPDQKLQIIYVGELIESVGEFALSGTGLTSIRFDPLSKVKTVQKGAFSANAALTELVLPPGLVHIPSMMCAECDS